MTTLSPAPPDTTDQDYEGFCEMLKHIDAQLDEGRWQQGDYVLSAIDRFEGTTYGKGIIKKLSMDTKIPESTLKLRRRMSRFYPPDKRQSLCDDYGINYSIMDVVRKAGDTVADVETFLKMHENNEEVETVEQYKRALKKDKGIDPDAKPKKLGQVSVVAYMDGSAYSLEIDDHLKPEWFESGKTYTVDVWGCKD